MTRFAALLLAAVALGLPAARAGVPVARVHHDLAVTLDPASRELAVGDALLVIGEAAAALRLPPGFAMNQMRIEGPGATLSRTDGVWRLRFAGVSEHRMTLGYRGKLPPMDEAGGTSDPGEAAAGPAGSYLPGGGGWYADFGGDPFTYILNVDVPEDQRAVAPGRLVDEAVADGRYRARFRVDWPAEDLAVMAGPYRVDERRHGGIRLRTYFHPEIADLSAAYLDKTGAYLDLYQDLIGDYPFPAFHVVSSPLPVGLGYPGLAYMGTRVLRLPFIRDTSLGHEVLHSWWGNGVYVDYATGNWAEGLTTFMADYAFAEAKGEDAARAMRLRWLNDYAALPASRDAPVSAFVGRGHGASRITGYNKSAMLFVMLRDEIGTQAFAAGIRRFWEDHRFRRAGWRDLRRAFEDETGRDLRRFFAQWLDQAGAPGLRLKSVVAAPLDSGADGGHRVSFTLVQDAPAYALSVPVTIETGSGPRRFRVPFGDRIERYSLDVDAPPLVLEIDADAKLFRRLAPGEVPTILRSVSLARKAVVAAATDDAGLKAAAEALARRLVEGEIEMVDRFAAPLFNEPLVIVGAGVPLGRLLAAAGLPATPIEVLGRGAARVWMARGERGYPAMVVEADDPAMLARIATRLPHYGAKSYLVFEDGAVTESGVWPPAEKPLRFAFP